MKLFAQMEIEKWLSTLFFIQLRSKTFWTKESLKDMKKAIKKILLPHNLISEYKIMVFLMSNKQH